MDSRKLYALFEKAGDAVFVVEPEGRICYWSRNAEKLLGFSRQQVLAKDCGAILAGLDEQDCEVCAKDCRIRDLARKRSQIAAYDLHAATASGERRWVSISIIVAHVKRGPSPLIVHLMRDIEERKSAETLTREIMIRVGELTKHQAGDVLAGGAAHLPAPTLTDREHAILESLSLGQDTKQMAADLNISTATVRNHVQRLLKKLNCHTRLEAVARAARQGWL